MKKYQTHPTSLMIKDAPKFVSLFAHPLLLWVILIKEGICVYFSFQDESKIAYKQDMNLCPVLKDILQSHEKNVNDTIKFEKTITRRISVISNEFP